MNFHLTHTGTTSIDKRDQHNPKQILAVGLGTVLSVAVIAGAAWSVAHEASPSRPAGRAPAMTALQAAPVQAIQPTTVYFVSAQEQAAQVQDGLAAAASYMSPSGAGDAPNAIVAVITSPAQESALLTSVSGMPDAYLVDLRTP